MSLDNGQATPLRILLVDDFVEWRTRARQVLERHPHWKVVGEARDGLEGVLKAAQFQPDVVILDIGLPGRNGIQAAREIRRKCPQIKVIFLSQETDRDIINAALEVGGAAFVPKYQACDLVRAIAAILQAAPAPFPSAD